MKKNYLYNLLLTVFNLVIPVITFPYVARVLGPAGVGKVQFIMTFSQYIALLAALGIPAYGVREVAKVKHEAWQVSKVFRELLIINGVASILLCLAYLIAIFSIPFFRADLDLYIYAATIVLFGFTSIEWLFTGLEQFKLIALRSIIVKTLAVALTLLLVKGKEDVRTYLLISIFGLLGNSVINIWSGFRLFNAPAGRVEIRKHIRPLIFLFGTTIASTLYTTFDSVILGFLSGDRAVGLYTAATRLTKIAIPVIVAYGAVLLPQITRSIEDNNSSGLEQHLNNSLAYISMLAVPLSIALFVFAPTIMYLFCGEDFGGAITTMRIMAFLPLLIGLGYFWGYQVILPMGKDKYLMTAAIVGMVASLALNFTLVPVLKQHGAAIANTVSEILVTCCYFLLIRKFVTMRIRHAYLTEAALSSLPFFAFMLLPADIIGGNAVVSMFVGGSLCTLAYLVMQIFVFRNRLALELLSKYRIITVSGR